MDQLRQLLLLMFPHLMFVLLICHQHISTYLLNDTVTKTLITGNTISETRTENNVTSTVIVGREYQILLLHSLRHYKPLILFLY